MSSQLTEQEAAKLGGDVRDFVDKLQQDQGLFDRFQKDPVATLSANGIQVPADKAGQLGTDLRPLFGAMGHAELQSAFGCWGCHAGLTIVLGVVIGAALAVIVAAVAAFFNVAAAAAMPWVSAAFDIGVVGATALAAYICWKAGACKSAAAEELALA